jgi:hypothetical protein
MWLRGPSRRFCFYFRLFGNSRREYKGESVRDTKEINKMWRRSAARKEGGLGETEAPV